jgi:hypothetical protein
MVQIEINENIVASVARGLFYEETNTYPIHINNAWNTLSEPERQFFRDKAVNWLIELKRVSPKTYLFVESNYAEVSYR